jgi:integrase
VTRDSHQPFSITKRKNSPFLALQFWDAHSQRYTSARSTKETSKRAAKLVAFDWLKEHGGPPPLKRNEAPQAREAIVGTLRRFLVAEGLVDPAVSIGVDELLVKVSSCLLGPAVQESNPQFTEYLLSFWDWDKSAYIKDKLESGQRISQQYAKANKAFVTRYAVPFFGEARLKSVTTAMLEAFKASLPRQGQSGAKGLSPRSINAVLGCVGTALEEAARVGLIADNPSRRLRKLASAADRRGVLTPTEIQKVFNSPWKDRRCRVASLLAACHGLRAGEVCALCISDVDIENRIIKVQHSWERHERKLKAPKNGHTRILYTDKIIIDELLAVFKLNPHKNSFIFWNSEKPDEPMNLDNIRDSLQEVLVASGITLDEQKQRKIDFHSWRHFANSAIRGDISDALLQQALGHSSTEMTERYYHMTPEQGAVYRESVSKNILLPILAKSFSGG